MFSIEEKNSLFRSLRYAKKDAKLRAAVERVDGKKAWGFYGQGVSQYEEALTRAFFPYHLRDHISERLLQHKKSFALDLAGPGQVLREMFLLSGGLAVTLGDDRSMKQKDKDDSQNITVLAGDILSKRTWKNMENWLKSQSSEGFDLILCNPVGGFGRFPESPDLFYYLIQQTWQLLNPDDGVFYGAPSSRVSTLLLRDWAEQLRNRGISALYSAFSIKLTRTPESPVILPTTIPWNK